MTKSKELPGAGQITNTLPGKFCCGFCVPGIIEGDLKKVCCVLIHTLVSFSSSQQELEVKLLYRFMAAMSTGDNT